MIPYSSIYANTKPYPVVESSCMSVAIVIGAHVRIYYEENSFDEGVVIIVTDTEIVVDFYDWIERWPPHQFELRDLYYENKQILSPLTQGEVVTRFAVGPMPE
jgi:hypothetical protein